MNNRDRKVFERIVQHSEEAAQTLNEYGNDRKTVMDSSTARNSLSMCVLQVGELVGQLHYETIETYPQIPWAQIRRMRNITAHHYSSFDWDILWETVTVDVPELKHFCKRVLIEDE